MAEPLDRITLQGFESLRSLEQFHLGPLQLDAAEQRRGRVGAGSS